MVAAYPSNYLVLLIIVVATASVAQSIVIISGIDVSGVIVAGAFAYPANPTISVAGVNITLSCDRGATTIGIQALTSPTGAFKVATTTGNGTLFEESKCAVYAHLLANGANGYSSPVLSADIGSLTIQAGVKLELGNGQIKVSGETGSSIAIYSTLPFVRVA